MLLSRDILTKFSRRGIDGWRYKIEPNSDFCRSPKEVHLCYLPRDFHTNEYLWISQKQISLDSVFSTGALFKCFHRANSLFDLLLRVTLKASLGGKKSSSKCGMWIRKKTRQFHASKFWIIWNINYSGLLNCARWVFLSTSMFTFS